MTVDLTPTQAAFFAKQTQQAGLRGCRLRVADCSLRMAECIKHIGLLTQAGGQHQINNRRKRIES